MRVLIADHAAIHETITAIVRKAFGRVSIRYDNTLEAALASAKQGKAPDLVLLELSLPGCTGIYALSRFREKLPEIPIVVFSKVDDRKRMIAALKAGAVAYLPNRASRKVMVAVLHLVAAGGIYLPAELLADIDLDAQSRRHRSRTGMSFKLTERQWQVLHLMLKGHSNPRIAAELHIALGTVKQHAHAIYDALDISTRAELFALAAPGRISDQSITKVV